ncbi:MAG: PAS domain S-box protein [Rubrivivax sp.]|nr:PAS domain S-box protein [Rubrivivax sp.]
MLHKPLQTLLVHLRSLKVRLALIGTLALAAGIGLSTALLMQRAERDTLQLAQVHQLEQAVHSARLLGVRLRDAHRALADALPQLNGPLIDDFSALQAFGATNPVLRGLFDSIFVVGGDGRLNLLWDDKGPRSPRTDLSDRPYFQVAMTEGRATVSDLFVGRVNSEPMVALAQPLVVQGRPVAVLVGGLMLLRRDIASVFTDASMDGQDPQIVVITDATGRILSHPQQGLVGAPLSAEPRMLQALARWRALGQPMWSSGQELGGSHGLAAVAGVPGADWLVWTWRDKTAVLAPLLAGRTQAMLAALVLLVLMGVGLLAIMARTLRPLALLQARAHRLFDAQRSTQDDWPAAQGEIGDLARVLRHVAAEKAQLETFTAQVIQRLQSVMAAAPVGICFTRKRRFELVSAEFCRLMGRGESLLLGQETHIIYASSEEFEALGPSVAAAFQAGRQFDAELRFRRGDGSCFTGRLRGQPVDAASSEAGTIWSLSDVTEDVAAREALQWAAAHDALTGLANRKALEQRLTRVFDLLRAPCRQPCCCSIWTASSRSTTCMAMPPETPCCVPWPPPSRPARAAPTWPCDWAGMSSRSCSSIAVPRWRCASPRRFVPRSAAFACPGTGVRCRSGRVSAWRCWMTTSLRPPPGWPLPTRPAMPPRRAVATRCRRWAT